jgi:hypothetical protein
VGKDRRLVHERALSEFLTKTHLHDIGKTRHRAAQAHADDHIHAVKELCKCIAHAPDQLHD